MPEVVYYVASSVDGFIATADGGVEWLAPFESSGEDYGYADFYASVDAILIGSHTFEQVLTFGEWMYADRPVQVFSKRALAHPENVVVTDRSPREVLAELEGEGVRRAWLVGGGALAGAFRDAGLITEYIVSIMPVVLGSGIGLFGGSGTLERLTVVDTIAFPDGVLQVRYRPA